MRAAAGQAEAPVTRNDSRAIDDFAFLDCSDGESGKIVFPRRINARHFCRLSADQCAAGLLASRRDAFYHLSGGRDVELAACEVVKKEQRFGTLHQNVI